MTPRRIFILGAARSGTKLLRDTLGEAAGVGVVPYDVNFVWKYGSSCAHDALRVVEDPRRSREFVASYLDRYVDGTSPPTVIEKTVGNTLRLEYVKSLFPDAAFVHLIRDGLDVIPSSMIQWSAPADRAYLRAKMRHFPLRLLPTYGVQFVKAQMRSHEATHAKSWGVRYPGIDEDLQEHGLLTVCARQWSRSLEAVESHARALDQEVVEVRYEHFVASPVQEIRRILDALSLVPIEANLANATRRINSASVGRGAETLSDLQLATLEAEVGDHLERRGYRRPSDSRR